MLIIGLDPGTGKSSPTGLAVIETEGRELLYSTTITSTQKRPAKVIKDIAEQLEKFLLAIDRDQEVRIYIECFVMRGKSGEVLARLTGALFSAIPYYMMEDLVFNTTVKKIVAGHGAADKNEVALGVRRWFSEENEDVVPIIDDLIEDRAWDALDAMAIAIAGHTRDTNG